LKKALTVKCPGCGAVLDIQNDKPNNRLVAFHDCGRKAILRPVWEMPNTKTEPASPAEPEQED
jgi:hypothetical protein